MSAQLRPEHDVAWAQAFRTTSLRAGFYLSLSQSQLAFLCACADDTRWDRFWDYLNGKNQSGAGHATAASLVKRGLLWDRRVDWKAWTKELSKPRPVLADGRPDLPEAYELTPAGKAVVELVKMTGLFVESDQSMLREKR